MTPSPRYSHPKALPFLFLTEMWERFGFYIAQGFLVLYTTEHFAFSDNAAYTISGVFSTLVCLSPFVGGFLADRILGFKTAIIWGGLFLIAGYAILAASTSLFIFFVGLSTIIVGNGLLKPNISSLLGTQYSVDNPKRDSGFTIFYVGINIGVALSGLSGYVKEAYGWGPTYALASLGTVCGLLIFLFALRYLKSTQKIYKAGTFLKFKIFFACLLAICGITFLLHLHALTNLLLPVSGLVLLALFIVIVLRQNDSDRKNLLILFPLLISSIFFWMSVLQIFNSANLYVARMVDKNLFGIHITTTVFWASESVYIFMLGPIFAWGWQVLGRHNKNPSAINKFILGFLFTSGSFCILAYSTHFPGSDGMINPLWVFSSYLLLTIGELLIVPAGLSAITIFSPERLLGMMMGIWFVAAGFGGYLSGWVAKLASISPSVESTMQKLLIYRNAFFTYAALALLVAFMLFVVRLLISSHKKRHH